METSEYMDEPNSRNLFDFTVKELQLSGRLLSAFHSATLDRTRFLGETITPEKNPTSGFVFLIDTNFNCALLNGEFLEDWYRCEAGHEGFFNDFKNSGNLCCLNCIEQRHAKLNVA